MAAQFGTSGLRGLATELLDGTAARHTASFLRHLLAEGAISAGDTVFMSGDNRDSTPALLADCAAAIAACGLVPVECGTAPTPALALHALRHRAAAIMVTGSHIPANRNGVKFYRPAGEITKADERAIIAGLPAIDGASFAPAAPASDGRAAWRGYAARYQGIAPADALKGWRIGIYQHSSVLRDALPRLLNALGAETVPLRRSDTFVPVDTEAVDATTLDALAGDIRQHQLDAVLSTDADGDRPLIIDAEGRQVRGDAAGIITARFLAASVIVTPITSNSAVARATGARTVLTQVGSPFVLAAMEEALAQGGNAVCGFEANGGFLLGSSFAVKGAVLPTMHLDALPTRDSVLPMLAVLLSAAQASQPVSALVAGLSLPIALGDRLQEIDRHKAGALVAELASSADALGAFLEGIGTAAATDMTDGLRITLADGRILHLRPSGNAPEMRCYAEAAGQSDAEALLAAGLNRLRARLA